MGIDADVSGDHATTAIGDIPLVPIAEELGGHHRDDWELVVDELYGDPEVYLRPEHGWQDYLLRLAHGVRQIALHHPQVFPLVATAAPEAPWVRPPLRSLRWMESFLDTLISYGFTDETAVTAYRTYTSFLVGQLLQEVSARGAELHRDEAVVEEADPKTPIMDLSEYPNLQRLEPALSEDHSAAEFEDMRVRGELLNVVSSRFGQQYLAEQYTGWPHR